MHADSAITPSAAGLESALQLLRKILYALDAAGVRYAVIHHAEDLESQLLSDVDIVLDRHPADALEPVFAKMPGLRLVQRLHYEIPYGFYYVLHDKANALHFLHLDVIYDPWGCNHYLYSSDELLNGRRLEEGIWTTAPAKEAAYLVIKKAIKGVIDAGTHRLIKERLDRDLKAAHREITRWFGATGPQLVQQLISSDKPEEWGPTLARLRVQLSGSLRRRGGLLGLRKLILDFYRKSLRAIRPTGLFVVVIGPDGSGKSTMVEAALAALKRGFRATWRFHWRPGLLPKPVDRVTKQTPTTPVTPPRGYAYGRVMSLLRYLYYLTDFIIGYWVVIYPKKVRTTLVMGERWYYDVIVNPGRYGFRLPSWLLRAGGRLIPEPDVAILLEAPADEIHARKPELSVKELYAQLQRMRAILPYSGCRISTTGSIDRSVAAVAHVVTDAAQRRTVYRRERAAPRDGWRAFPKSGDAKLWIHARDPIMNALHLYHPYSWIGRAVVRMMGYLPRHLTTQCLLPADEPRLERFAEAIRNMLGYNDLVISFSTGTPTAHRKITAQVSREGVIIAYVKIGSGEAAKKLMQMEVKVLSALDPGALTTAVLVPQVLAQATVDDNLLLALSAPPNPGRQRSTALDERDIRFLSSLIPRQPAVKSPCSVLEAIGLGPTDRRGYPDFIGHACDAVAAVLKEGVRISPAHGDYVPWNTLVLNDGRLYVFDWEHAGDAPSLSDLFHRTFMPDRLVNGGIPSRAAMSRLLSLVNAELTRPILEKCEIAPNEYPAYLLIYFLQLSVRETREKGGIDGYLQECIHMLLGFIGHSAHRLRVLISAYACEPHKGSEPGVGWGWVQEITRDHDAWVITRANNRDTIETELSVNPNPHLHMIYVDLPPWARFWKRKQRGIRTYYYLWQFAAWSRARKLCREVRFDLAHHVTFVNDWLWTFLALMPLPYVWGPIGSNARSPSKLLRHFRARRADLLRVTVQNVVRWVDPLWWLTAIRASRVITINNDVAVMRPLRDVAAHKIYVEPAIAVDKKPNDTRPRDGSLVLYVGRHLAVKGGALAVETFARVVSRRPGVRLIMIGEGPEEEDLRNRVRRLGIGHCVEFVPWQTQQEIWHAMEVADIFFFPSMEGAGMVVLEAMRAGLPVVCLEFGGPGTMITQETGCRVAVGPFDQVADALAAEIISLLDEPLRRERLGEAARRRTQDIFSWEAKRTLIRNLYRDVLYFREGQSGMR